MRTMFLEGQNYLIWRLKQKFSVHFTEGWWKKSGKFFYGGKNANPNHREGSNQKFEVKLRDEC